MGDFVKVHVMHCGDVTMDRALPYREKTWHPAPYTGLFRSKSKRVTVPISAYLIEHPQGLVLVDTGWSEVVRTEFRGHVGFLNSLAFRGSLPVGASVHEQLAARGILPRDLDFVVISHLHADPVSALNHVREAKKIITSRLEWEAGNRQFDYVKSMWEEFILPGVLVSQDHAINSLRWVQEFAKRDDCTAVIANHDPGVRPGSY